MKTPYWIRLAALAILCLVGITALRAIPSASIDGHRTSLRAKLTMLGILEHGERPMLVVPFHSGDLPKGLFLRILKVAGFTMQDFLE